MLLELLMPIKDRLKQLRKAAGMTQQALAFKAGLSVSAVVHLESGRIPDPRASTLRALADALNCSMDELVGPKEEPPLEPEPPAKKPGRKKGGK